VTKPLWLFERLVIFLAICWVFRPGLDDSVR